MPEIITQSVGGKLVTVTSEFVRPANTTAYTAGDVVSNDATTTVLLKFPGVVRSVGGSGYVVNARIETDLKTETAQYRLMLYKVPEAAIVVGGPTVSVPADNAPDTTIYANRAYRIGYLDIPQVAEAADGTNSTAAVAQWTGAPLAFSSFLGTPASSIPGDTGIYGKLVNMTGTTPASGQKFSVTLTVQQN